MKSLCQIGCVRISSGVVAWCFCKLDQILTTFCQKGFAKIFDCKPVFVKYQKLSSAMVFNSFSNNSFHGFLLSTSKYFLTHVSFNDFANSLVFGTFRPPFSYSFIITDRLILSVFPPHMKWKMILSNSLKNSFGGSDRTVKIWTRIGRAKVFTTVTLPIIDRFRKDQSCNNFLTLFSFSVKLSS